MKKSLAATLFVVAVLVGTAATLSKLSFRRPTAVTISSGKITPTQLNSIYSVSTEGGAAFDTLTTVDTAVFNGQYAMFYLQQANVDSDISISDGVGNIVTGSGSIVLADGEKPVICLYNPDTETVSVTGSGGIENGTASNQIPLWNDTSGKWEPSSSTVTDTELGYLSGVSSAIQTQLNNTQPLDAELTALAGLTSAADKLPYFTGSETAAVADLTSAGRAILDDADASAQRTTLGVAIGSDVQAYDAGLADIAGLATTDGNIIVGSGSNWVAESGATARTSLGLGTSAVLDAGNSSGNVVTRSGANAIAADAISEITATNGVSVDGLTLKDAGFALGSDADGDTYYRSSGALARLSIGSANYALRVNSGGTAPEWAAVVDSTAFDGSSWTSDTVAPAQSAIEDALEQVAIQWGDRADALSVIDNNVPVIGSVGNGGLDGNVEIMLHCDDGESVDFYDSSDNHFSPTITDAIISSTKSKFGGSSGYFNGTSAKVVYADSGLDAGATWSFDCWVYCTSIPSGRATVAWKSANFVLSIDGGATKDMRASINGVDYLNSLNAFPVNQWVHVAWTMESGVLKMYQNGTEIYSVGSVPTPITTGANLVIGSANDLVNNFFAGYIDEVRFSIGVVRDNFTPTPPASAYTNSNAFAKLGETLVIRNATPENGNGIRESQIDFVGLSSTYRQMTLARIQGAHDGSSDDDLGQLTFSTNNGSALASALTIDSSQVITFDNFPVTPSSAPTTDYQAANKKYVDDAIDTDLAAFTGTSNITTIGTISTGSVPWANVDKTTSSLADVTTRSAGDLSSGNLNIARMPTGGDWATTTQTKIYGAITSAYAFEAENTSDTASAHGLLALVANSNGATEVISGYQSSNRLFTVYGDGAIYLLGNEMQSITGGTSDNDKLVSQGYVDDAIDTDLAAFTGTSNIVTLGTITNDFTCGADVIAGQGLASGGSYLQANTDSGNKYIQILANDASQNNITCHGLPLVISTDSSQIMQLQTNSSTAIEIGTAQDVAIGTSVSTDSKLLVSQGSAASTNNSAIYAAHSTAHDTGSTDHRAITAVADAADGSQTSTSNTSVYASASNADSNYCFYGAAGDAFFADNLSVNVAPSTSYKLYVLGDAGNGNSAIDGEMTAAHAADSSDHYAGRFVASSADSGYTGTANYALITSASGADTNYCFYGGAGDAFFAADVSALTFTDRTPFYDGDAVSEIIKIKGDGNGHIDHSSLPEFAQKNIKTLDNKTKKIKNIPGRDLGAMISILIKAIQQQQEQINELKEKIK